MTKICISNFCLATDVMMDFLSCLHFAIGKSCYQSINLKPKQVQCLAMEALYNDKDVFAVSPTGYGKFFIYHILPSLLARRNSVKQTLQNSRTTETTLDAVQAFPSPVVLVVSPLNSLMEDQIRKINQGTDLRAGVFKVTLDENREEETSPSLRTADLDIIFTHPESCLSSKEGLRLLQSDAYKKSVQTIVVDEAHCILEW